MISLNEGFAGGWNIKPEEINDDSIAASLLAFGEDTLGYRFYAWQDDTITPFDFASRKLVMISLCTPNGSGKSSVVIPTVALGWLAMYKRGRVVITTKDSKQLDNQVLPAIMGHRAKFPDWKFIDREVHTPDADGNFAAGGQLIAFCTDEAGRAEGWHKLDDFDGPLLIIADEAKSIPEKIFEAMDRCTYNAILLTSSPGYHRGRFYESQFLLPNWIKIRVGLKDCPHIMADKDKIQRLMDQYGPEGLTPNPQFLKSTLNGEFMEATAEGRFNAIGLAKMRAEADVYERQWRIHAAARPHESVIGELIDQPSGGIQWLADIDGGWLWLVEAPIPGCEYIAFCDPMTGAQSEGSLKRDTHAAGVIRLAYIDAQNKFHDAEVVCAIFAKGDGARWDNDVLAERVDIFARYFGDCMIIVEANNSGTEVMRLLQLAGRRLWLREKRDASGGGRKLQVVGFFTSAATKNHWIGAIGRFIREKELICRFPLAVGHLETFILGEDGSGEAQEGCFDDWVTGLGLALFARGSATRYAAPKVIMIAPARIRGAWS